MRFSEMPSSTFVTRVLCTLIFLVFTFCFIFFFQGDLLAVAQHILSGGQTSYNHTVGAILLTLLLYALHWVVKRYVKLTGRSYSLTYLPSFLILTLLTYISAQVVLYNTLLHLLWIIPLLFVVSFFVVRLVRYIQPVDQFERSMSMLSRELWANLLIMVLMMMTTVITCNADKTLHKEVHHEIAMLRHRAEIRTQKQLKAEQDSIRNVEIQDSIKAAKKKINLLQ